MRVVTVTLFLAVSVICSRSAKSARILGISHMAAYSHYRLSNTIFKGLAARGHEVTVITPYTDDENTSVNTLKQVILTGVIEELEESTKNIFDETSVSVIETIVFQDQIRLHFTENTLNHTNVQKLLKSNEQFDLVILEQFLNEAFKGFCHRFQASCVVLSTVGGSRWTNPQMGNPEPPSYVPDLYLSFSSKMNFSERLYNSFIYLLAVLFTHLYMFPKQNEILHRYFPDAPHLYDLYYNTSLILLNSHVSINPAVPYVPNMIEIGGFHIKPPKKLPKDLQDYLDNAKDGAVFFSLGSYLKSKDLPKEKREVILKALSKLKQKVLWKWEDETLSGKPSNVKISKWLPQEDILAHPNIRLFITHGGLLSTIETVYYGVPIVGIPIFGDQEMNVANAKIAGYGVGVPYETLTAETLSAALKEVLYNPKYTQNAKTRSKMMRDQPMKPLDKAIFWLEYVIRHQGAPHLRTAALSLRWYQYLLLDVAAFIAVVFLMLVYISYKTVRICCCRKSPKDISEERKKK